METKTSNYQHQRNTKLPADSEAACCVTLKVLTPPVHNPRGGNDLYYRMTGCRFVKENTPRHILPDGAFLSTDTFFNVLSAQTLRQQTSASHIRYALSVAGKMTLTIHTRGDSPGSSRVVHQQSVESQERTTVTTPEFPIDSLEEVVFFRLEAAGNEAIFFGGEIEGRILPSDITPVRLLCSMTTYRREADVRRNIACFERFANEFPELSANVDIQVVDNGNTLSHNDSPVHLIPNANLGGSGGCARGMLELDEQHSHFAIFDDDIFFDPLVLANAIYLLRIAKDRATSIGSILLELDRPTQQHEAGATLSLSGIRTNRPQVDLSNFENVVANEFSPPQNYCG